MGKLKISASKQPQGQIIILVAASLVVLIAAVGLATDAVIIYLEKQNLQRAVDSAALAASRKLPNYGQAEQTAHEFMRLYGYDFSLSENELEITFPTYSPPRKVVSVKGTTVADFFFLNVVGWSDAPVAAVGVGESAPLDVYLVLDLSLSMVYDTRRPGWRRWPRDAVDGCTDWNDWTCVALYCNEYRRCDPLDEHIKPAAKFFVDELSTDYDRIGLVGYDRKGVHVLPLESDFNVVKDAIDNMDAYNEMGRSTNIGDGIMFAHQNMALEGRMDAIWAMVLLTDGRANVYRSCPGCPPDCGGFLCQELHDDCHGCPQAEGWAIDNAIDTWQRHETVIYTIAYGEIFEDNPSYRQLMIEIADRTDNGVRDYDTDNFFVAPDEDTLREALVEIAERIFTRLIR